MQFGSFRFLSFLFGMMLINSCTKESLVVGEGEPIAILEPIQNPTQAESGKEVKYEINIVTDRNIDSVTVHMHLDTSKAGYKNGDPITLVNTHTVPTITNLSKFSGAINMPANRKYGDVVRIIYQLRAKDRYAQKILRIDVK